MSTEVADRAFEAAVEPHRRELLVHCYRMLGSAEDAQDVLQETLTRAWRAFDRYDPSRASMRTWLYRIATNASLNALDSRARRPLPADVGPVFEDPEAPFAPTPETPWLQPLPDVLLGTPPADPAIAAEERARLRLAVVAAHQLLPASQRAALLLREVLDVPAAEVADLLDTTTAAVNSSLQRARAALAAAGADPEQQLEPEADQLRAVEEWIEAFEAADVGRLKQLVHHDVVLEMPPMWNWYRGAEHYAAFMSRIYRVRGTRWHTTIVGANGAPAAAVYVAPDDMAERFTLHTIQLMDVRAGRIDRVSVFQDPAVLASFGLPSEVIAPPR